MLMVALSGSIFGKNSTPLPNLAKEKIAPTKEEQLLKLMDDLDDDDDVNNIYTNAEI